MHMHMHSTAPHHEKFTFGRGSPACIYDLRLVGRELVLSERDCFKMPRPKAALAGVAAAT